MPAGQARKNPRKESVEKPAEKIDFFFHEPASAAWVLLICLAAFFTDLVLPKAQFFFQNQKKVFFLAWPANIGVVWKKEKNGFYYVLFIFFFIFLAQSILFFQMSLIGVKSVHY